jgi:hypothetical protein
MDKEIKPSDVSMIMVLFVQQGEQHDEMKRRAALLKLEVAKIEAAFEVLERAGLRAEGNELTAKQ